MDKRNQNIGEQLIRVPFDQLDQILADKGSPAHKLLLDPEGYAKKAIEVLQEQLTYARTENKRNKLRHRIAKWQKTLEVLEG